MKSILIVDDAEINRKFILPIFEEDFMVLEASNGNEALTILKSNHVDLVITDIFMPEMDGYMLTREIRKNKQLKDIPVIAVTENDEASQEDAIKAGANCYIMRPMDSNELKKQAYKLTSNDVGRKNLIHSDFLLSSIPGAIFVYKIYSDHYEILLCSRGIKQLTGWNPEDFCNAEMNQQVGMVHPNDEEAFLAMMKKLVKTKSHGELIYRGYKKDGSVIWLWFQGHYIGEEDGCPLVEAVVLSLSDNGSMYQMMLDQTASLVTIVDANTFEVVYANKAAIDAVCEDGLGKYVGTTCYRRVMSNNAPCSSCIVNNSDEDSWVNPQIEIKGRFYKQIFKRIKWHGREAILEFTTDITEQVENAKTLITQRKLNATILDTIPAGIMVFKLAGEKMEIISANRGICEMTGMDSVKAIGAGDKEIFDLTHPDDRHIVADVAKKLSIPNTYVEYEYRQYYASRKKYVWVLGQGRSEVNPDDGCVYAYVSYTDITARKEVSKLQDRLKIAEVEASTKAEFYSQMSHDMRTPMNGILGLARLAQKEKDINQIHKDIDQILQSGQYMLGLINDTLDLQRLETGRITFEPKVIKSRQVFNEIFEMINPGLKEKNLNFEFNVADDDNDELNWYIRIDPLRFKQMVTNLLSNSIKFTPVGGTISLTLKETGRIGNISKNSISITDSGIGMSQEFIENKLYKPFSQENSVVTGKYGGSGLGLSIVKRLVDLMGGRIEVQSELGEGTTFTVYIDVEIVTSEEAEQIEKMESSFIVDNNYVFRGKRILLCEDHPLNAQITKRILETKHCDIEWAEDGAIGLAMFEASEAGYYNAILMDIRMPNMNGLEATKKIRASKHADGKVIPIIAMSANAYQEDIKSSIDAGMNDHLAKPVNPDDLFKTLGKYISK